jgi:hypothetical protein
MVSFILNNFSWLICWTETSKPKHRHKKECDKEPSYDSIAQDEPDSNDSRADLDCQP